MQASHPCFKEPEWLRADRVPTQDEWVAAQESIAQVKRICRNQRLAIPSWVTRCGDLGSCTEIRGSTATQRPWSVAEVAQRVSIGGFLALADGEGPARTAIADSPPSASASSSQPAAPLPTAPQPATPGSGAGRVVGEPAGAYDSSDAPVPPPPTRPSPPAPVQTHGWERWRDGEGHYWWSHEPSRRFFFEDHCPSWMQWRLVNESTGDFTRWWARYDDEWNVVEYFCES